METDKGDRLLDEVSVGAAILIASRLLPEVIPTTLDQETQDSLPARKIKGTAGIFSTMLSVLSTIMAANTIPVSRRQLPNLALGCASFGILTNGTFRESAANGEIEAARSSQSPDREAIIKIADGTRPINRRMVVFGAAGTLFSLKEFFVPAPPRHINKAD